MKIIAKTWNMNHKCNYNSCAERFNHKFIIDSLKLNSSNERPLFFILTEIYKVRSFKIFCKKLDQYGYTLISSNNINNNEIVIGIHKEVEIIDDSIFSFISSSNNRLPNFLKVDVKINNKRLTIAGARIRQQEFGIRSGSLDDQQDRASQCRRITKELSKITNPILLAGDFNTYRKDTQCTRWNTRIMQNIFKKIGLSVHTPNAGSWDHIRCPNLIFPLDHFFERDLLIDQSTLKYDRHFTNNNSSIYSKGTDLSGIKAPYPDHAQLIAEFEF